MDSQKSLTQPGDGGGGGQPEVAESAAGGMDNLKFLTQVGGGDGGQPEVAVTAGEGGVHGQPEVADAAGWW